MWNDGDWQKLRQSMHRALTSQVKKDWQNIMGDIADRNEINRDVLKVLDEGTIKIPPNFTLQNGAQRFFQINSMLPYHGKFACDYIIEELNKVITKRLLKRLSTKTFGPNESL